MEKPKIRFKGYQEDWEQRKFGDYNDLMTGYPFESDKFSEDGIKLVRGMNVKRGYLDFSEDICVKWNSCVGLENFLLKDGDILIQMDGALIGKSYAKIKENQLPALLVQRVTRARTNNKFASQDFMYQTIQRDFLRYIEMNKTETAVPHLSLNDIRNFEIMVPCLAEQKKIGEYFDSLDDLITLHQRKREEMKTLKKYMLQKMFPQNGQLVPQIRFSGFTEDWEQRKLGNITVKIGSGKTPLGGKSAYVETGIPLIRSQNVNGDKVDFADIVYIDEATDELMANSRVYTNDVLLNITGASIGRSAVYEGLESANVNQHVCIIRPTEGHQPDFIQLNLSSDNGQKQIDASQAGGGREGLNFQEIGKMQFSFPSLNEQKAIGRYFNCLDHLITLHQQKCDELRNIKKFMLQNMFV